MMDKFNNKKPVQIEIGEWWFNGRIIQQNNHPNLSKFTSFRDNDHAIRNIETHGSFNDAIKSCLADPDPQPSRFPRDYIGGEKNQRSEHAFIVHGRKVANRIEQT